MLAYELVFLFIFSSQLHAKFHLVLFIMQKPWDCHGRMELKPQDGRMLCVVLHRLHCAKFLTLLCQKKFLQLLFFLSVRLSCRMLWCVYVIFSSILLVLCAFIFIMTYQRKRVDMFWMPEKIGAWFLVIVLYYVD